MASSVSLIFALFCLLIWHIESASLKCPLNFTILNEFPDAALRAKQGNLTVKCLGAKQGLHLVLADYLRKEGLFLPPMNTSEACWSAFQTEINVQDPNFDVRKSCGFNTSSISQGCMDITTQQEFETKVPLLNRQSMNKACNQTLTSSPCAQCAAALTSTQVIYLSGSPLGGNLRDCSAYSSIYAAAILNAAGPTDKNTAWCLFFIGLSSNSRKNSAWVYGAAAAGVSLCILGVVVGFLYWRRRRKRILAEFGCLFALRSKLKSAISQRTVTPAQKEATLLKHEQQTLFTLGEIIEATDNFNGKNKLGEGGFGPVYRGKTRDGNEIAVKKLSAKSAQGKREFMNEVELVANVQHRNLVKLIGCCAEESERLLVYEYLPNKSLDTIVFDAKKKSQLDWQRRYNIIMGIARGLLYLHEDSRLRIIHRDIKASNILLDQELKPKIADFGLARLFPENVTHVQTKIAGTYGYMAPEYAMHGRLSMKVDVYSFGVLIIEIVSGGKTVIQIYPSKWKPY